MLQDYQRYIGLHRGMLQVLLLCLALTWFGAHFWQDSSSRGNHDQAKYGCQPPTAGGRRVWASPLSK
jgi:hypothetical protein